MRCFLRGLDLANVRNETDAFWRMERTQAIVTSRRDFLRLLPLSGCSLALTSEAAEFSRPDAPDAVLILEPQPGAAVSPLQRMVVRCSSRGTLILRDGDQQPYLESPFDGELQITVAGALGTHSVAILSSERQLLASSTFEVDCQTGIVSHSGRFEALLRDLYWTMASDGPVGSARFRGLVFTYWVPWLMDNTNTLKGMKYFWPEVTSNVDFYVASQREDGMVWENFEVRKQVETDWERRFNYGDFTRPAEDGRLLLRRAPVESHVEAFLLEAIYTAWKITGDTAWMSAKLDGAIKAVQYATSDPYRWSTKYRLLKRGFTIDTWDFLCESEAKLAGDDAMRVELDKTHFGVFHGDNTNMIAGLFRLAEMLDAAGRGKESPHYHALALELQTRLDSLSWNGQFFTHWIPEDRSLSLDMGVDLAKQVSLSNAYGLNRGISHEKCAAIIHTYLRIRAQMPSSSPGEFYAIYPPFERGFGREDEKWEYMNGGVMSCVAGELAKGAFEHGFEEYGVDILHRYQRIAERHNNYVPGILRGKVPDAPPRTLTPIDLRRIANADFGAGAPGVPGWTGEPGNDLANMPSGLQRFREVPFDVIDPGTNGRRACLAISSAEGYLRSVSVPIHSTARSIYLLHTKGGDNLAGKLTWRFADGTSHWEFIQAGMNVNHWWAPTDSEFDYRYGPGGPERMQVAWRGKNQKFGNVGVYVTSFDNPSPEKQIASLDLECIDTGAKWMVLGITVSDAAAFLPPRTDVSSGMPNNWGAAALTAALIEGLCGVRDNGTAFSDVTIAPRWLAAAESQATVSVRYPASRGYVAYEYRHDAEASTMTVVFTGSAVKSEVAVLLPSRRSVGMATLDGQAVQLRMRTIETSTYAVASAEGRAVHTLLLHLSEQTQG